MKIKYSKDCRKYPQWEKVISIEFHPESIGGQVIVKTKYHGWILLSDCKVINGNFNIRPTKSLDKRKVRDALSKLYDCGQDGISYVGRANYAARESEARSNLREMFDNQWERLFGKKS